jgi:hypothetical protein
MSMSMGNKVYFNLHTLNYKCANFGAFVKKCKIGQICGS